MPGLVMAGLILTMTTYIDRKTDDQERNKDEEWADERISGLNSMRRRFHMLVIWLSAGYFGPGWEGRHCRRCNNVFAFIIITIVLRCGTSGWQQLHYWKASKFI